jgi:hypothetical protein
MRRKAALRRIAMRRRYGYGSRQWLDAAEADNVSRVATRRKTR